MKKLTLLICLLLTINTISFAQFPKTFPEDGLDANVGISYNFYNNESQNERQAFMKKFTRFAIEKGFNVVDELELSANMTEVEKVQYKKRNDSLQVKYTLAAMQHSKFNIIMILRVSDYQSKRYIENNSFQAALDLFVKDIDKFKASHPEANKSPYENKLSAATFDSNAVDDEEVYEEPVFIQAVKYVNELPADLASQTLLFTIYDDIDISPEDSALISAEELVRRKKKILKYRKMNAKFKENFIEYPYPVKYVYERELKELSKSHPYQLVDNYRLVSKIVPRSASVADGKVRVKSVYVHNYCIKDQRKTGTYYRLPSWEDCDKELENGCLKYVVKTILKKDAK